MQAVGSIFSISFEMYPKLMYKEMHLVVIPRSVITLMCFKDVNHLPSSIDLVKFRERLTVFLLLSALCFIVTFTFLVLFIMVSRPF